MHIDVFSDVICPWCFIGKRRLARALAAESDVSVTLRWRAFMLNPDMPAEGMDRQTYMAMKFGGPAQARRVYDNVLRAAEAEGLELAIDRIPRTPSTVAAHRLIRWATEQGDVDPVLEGLFRAYFQEGRDIGQASELTAIAAAAGLDPDEARAMLARPGGDADIVAEDRSARRIGINGVPCFIFDGQYAVSGAQEPEVFAPIFAAARAGALTSSAAQ
ncbi:putative DsbA family dithiol-disulfide isomerase [Stella humosa]|uniref:Putative DsbA family dithiol-disulfide isomerase n=1 Tax=Stella humosa TaxID=94 RepID=A0A3N1MDC2_9PROT|nr:DsbA family oxidoreductase [Stella humosa]ROQ01713.1 putative DsbA family dithiol-disulfide isomerase [Stella humosa]BBK32095.1 DSBA oxidoreductase [Stella humosa]